MQSKVPIREIESQDARIDRRCCDRGERNASPSISWTIMYSLGMSYLYSFADDELFFVLSSERLPVASLSVDTDLSSTSIDDIASKDDDVDDDDDDDDELRP